MRSIRAILTASGFLVLFAGMVVLSALTTSMLHSAFSARPVPLAAIVQ